MRTYSKLWTLGVLACPAALVLAAVIWPHQSFRLTAFSDIIQCVLLISGTASFLPRAFRAEGRMRLFWSLMAAGVAFWLCYQLLWTGFEVILHRDVPDLFTGDIILFLHIVPLTAALALQPHLPPDEYAARLGRLDFALLLLWWVYLYVLIVTSWQYAVPDLALYSRNLNAVYLVEKLVFLCALAACWFHTKGSWRRFYASLFGTWFAYSGGSYIANWAIQRNVYYSGSLYDIPLAAAMASITWIGLWTRANEPEPEAPAKSSAYGVWVARFGMIAAFSLPLFGAWALLDTALPPPVRHFRLGLTLAAALAMGIMVFVRQHLLDRELVRLLKLSRASVDNLQHLQAQLLQSEKMASIGQLVGGAAHELNNPITAMLGYSDLLLATELNAEQRTLAAKIGQYVRRTRALVASLLSFARHAPRAKTSLDLNTLARTAVKLTQDQWQALNLKIRVELDNELPRVFGDSNRLLQVCLQVVSDAILAIEQRGGRTLTLATRRELDLAVLVISGDAPADSPRHDSSSHELGDCLGFSACQAILREHQGRIIFEQDKENAVRIELPILTAASATLNEPAVPGLWPSQPFA